MNDQQLIEDLNKDFSLELNVTRNRSELEQLLAQHLNELIKTDFDRLVNYLYRIDVDEEKLKMMLLDQPMQDAGLTIACLIIERQEQKIRSRQQFSQRDPGNIKEDELF